MSEIKLYPPLGGYIPSPIPSSIDPFIESYKETSLATTIEKLITLCEQSNVDITLSKTGISYFDVDFERDIKVDSISQLLELIEKKKEYLALLRGKLNAN